MFTVAGATGHVGSVVASELLGYGCEVEVIVRNQEKGKPWRDKGARVAVADLGDRAALAEVLRGSDGLFAMLPSNLYSADPDADHLRMADAIAGAVADSGVGHVVMLSSLGAELAEGTGVIRYLHHLENGLRASGTTLTALRCCHFQENLEELLNPARADGVFPVFAASADVPTPMIATRDIGAAAAESLRSRPASSEVVDLLGPEYTYREAAEYMAAELGTELQVVLVPRPAWAETIAHSGVSPEFGAVVAELYEADERRLLKPKAQRSVTGATALEETLRAAVSQPKE